MDFSKLNVEFSNMQKTITKHNELIAFIKLKIKNNEKDISKYDNKVKNTKNIIEKDSFKLVSDIYKNENTFLKQLIESEEEKNEKSV